MRRGREAFLHSCILAFFAFLASYPHSVAAQAPPEPVERLTFRQAVDRAIANNPSSAVAAAVILRAEGLLSQARSATLLEVTGNVTTTTLNRGVSFEDTTVTPRNQVAASLTIDQPIVAAADWARRAQAQDNRDVAVLSAVETRRQIAVATADAYLAIIALRQLVEGDIRARDNARAHFDLATQLEQQGTGSRLNALRAQQQVSTFERNLEVANLAVYRAQEALGILVVADGPVDAGEEPVFDVPTDPAAAGATRAELAPVLLQARPDLRLFTGEEQAAARVLRDSSKDRWPSLNALFLPQSVYPGQFFTSPNNWRFLLQSSIPIFDGGMRSSLRVQRQAALDVATANLAGGITQASSEVRAARESVASGLRALAAAQRAAQEAQQVVNIVNISFGAGAATNIEVIDAERSARDADTAVAAAEHILRRARLDLLQALGRFP
ncbi:MAG TPA: TolC family protein [Vicinamibacterales bacterium]|jgi:outer membrane protein TolC|nr:TolC family protein [Vicinamibacterales bacterium]